MEGEFKIKLKDNREPFSLMTPRRVALSLLPKVKELLRMEKLGVISKLTYRVVLRNGGCSKAEWFCKDMC